MLDNNRGMLTMQQDTYLFNSVIVAKYIIACANDKCIPINITKVQKLLYISYGIYLAVTGKRLTNEHPHAWPYGPVFPTTRNKILKLDIYSINKDDADLASIKDNEEFNTLLNLVFNSFGSWSAAQLTEWSHSNGSPWEMTTCLEGFKWGMTIPDSFIQGYFKNLVYVK